MSPGTWVGVQRAYIDCLDTEGVLNTRDLTKLCQCYSLHFNFQQQTLVGLEVTLKALAG